MRIAFSIIACALLACCAIQSPQAGPVGFRLSSVFKPNQIPGLQLWLDASQIVGLNDGDAVATWSDLSGNGRDFTQATASKRPLYKTNQRGALPTVLFDGIDDHLQASFSCTAKTIVVVFRITGGALYSRPVDFRPDYKMVYRGNSNTEVGAYNGGFGPSLTGLGTGYLVATYTFDATTSGLRINGVTATPVAGAWGTALSGTHTVGAQQDANFALNGYVAHVLLYDSVLTAAQAELMETYFATH